MKKLLIPIALLAIFVAIHQQTLPNPNVYIEVIALVIVMFSIMKLSAKIPSKNDNSDEHDDTKRG